MGMVHCGQTGAMATLSPCGNVTNKAIPGRPVPATLAALKSDAAIGDGHYTGRPFRSGEAIKLGNGTLAHYAANTWSSGPMP